MLAGLDGHGAATRLLEEGGARPSPDAFRREPLQATLLRLCFAKHDATLAAGIDRLRALR